MFTPFTKLLLWALVAFPLVLHHCLGARCGSNIPTVKQVQVGFSKSPKFSVEVRNNCPVCPAIDIHVNCGNFSQDLVSSKLIKVLNFDDCVVNNGLPLSPLQKLSFTYSHSKFLFTLKSWSFQCE